MPHEGKQAIMDEQDACLNRIVMTDAYFFQIREIIPSGGNSLPGSERTNLLKFKSNHRQSDASTITHKRKWFYVY